MIQRLIGVVASTAILISPTAFAAPYAALGTIELTNNLSIGQLFVIRNDSTAGEAITQVFIDLPGAVFFAPYQSSSIRVSDVVTSGLTNSNITITQPTTGPNPGLSDDYQNVTISFTSFNPGDYVVFGYNATDPVNNTQSNDGAFFIQTTFSNNQTTSGIAVDVNPNLIIADAVGSADLVFDFAIPEPVALSAVGLLGLTMLRRRSA